jgi:histidinol-phosphate aminotransferase
MHGYVPGEQPKVVGLIKLNTNENPYPPSPRVLEAIRATAADSLRLYPDPSCAALREKIAQRYGVDASCVLVGNGSDEILSLATRAFVGEGQTLAYFEPSYSLYPVLADIQGTQKLELPLDENFLPEAHANLLHKVRDARLLFITQPNAPSGVWFPRIVIQRLAEEMNGVVFIDEAYVDFCSENCLDFAAAHTAGGNASVPLANSKKSIQEGASGTLALPTDNGYPNVLVARTFSKSFSLAGVRVGWVVGARPLIEGLDKVKDSYNVNRLSQAAALAALDDWEYFESTRKKVIATRERLKNALEQLGFFVYPSQTNFLLVRPPRIAAQQYFQSLRERKILVRWWDKQRLKDFVRISIGTDEQMDVLLKETKEILAKG